MTNTEEHMRSRGHPFETKKERDQFGSVPRIHHAPSREEREMRADGVYKLVHTSQVGGQTTAPTRTHPEVRAAVAESKSQSWSFMIIRTTAQGDLMLARLAATRKLDATFFKLSMAMVVMN